MSKILAKNMKKVLIFALGALFGIGGLFVAVELFETLECDADCRTQREEALLENDEEMEKEPIYDEGVSFYGTVYAQVDAFHPNSVTFTLEDLYAATLRFTYEFSEDVVIEIMQNKKLVEVSPSEEAVLAEASSGMNYFYIRVHENKVQQIIQDTEGALFYITNGPSYRTGMTLGYGLSLDPLAWLSEAEGTCVNPSTVEPTLPLCNPNGYLIVNEIEEEEGHDIDDNVSIYTTNFGASPESTYEMSLEDFVTAFNSNKDYYTQVPFEVDFRGTPDFSPVISLKEIYIP